MIKKILFYILLVVVTFFASACDEEKSQILFNKHPFTQDTMLSTTENFKPGDRIYYLVTLPIPVEKKRLFIQIIKIGGGEAQYLGHELVWSKNVKLKEEQKYYYTDYVVLNEKGAYNMNVYSRDNPTQILSSARFYIKD